VISASNILHFPASFSDQLYSISLSACLVLFIHQKAFRSAEANFGSVSNLELPKLRATYRHAHTHTRERHWNLRRLRFPPGFIGVSFSGKLRCVDGKILPKFRKFVALVKMKNKGKIRNNIEINYVKMK